ncbi:PLP-dependent aminotransferase family protein [Compostimonas suwonensis]|uniref:DNA-binding transcriptional MocR family regulator n=1 Tax=Compostimonas suwonensis TaxID=1048394 RepID=A0A2M9C4R5_9MICO|nr:PLP-dependent aminotransferase family protein [Compostimonas suwonensis]PJJ65518.1 DNA-binding transcriptional MocR family regulator [Compostimonas suwonensis]
MTPVQLSARALDTLLGDWRGAAPAYQALADRLRLLTIDGRIPIDTRLPAERELSTVLGLSRTTVAAAYRELREAGFLQSVRGSGSAIRLPGTIPIQTASTATAPGVIDFTKAALPAAPGLADAAARAAARLPAHLGDPGYDPVGLPELRAAIAEGYTERGVPTGAEQIMVTVGAQHAIALLARVLLGRGDRALIETPTYPHAYEALRVAGARLVPVSVSADFGAHGDEPGWDETALMQSLQRSNPALAYLMPDFHNPTGQSMPLAQRERLLATAAQQGTVVIADETAAQLDIDRVGDFPPLAALGDAVTIGSVGKTLWGGIRLGWIRAERPLIRKLVAARASGDLGTPILEQLLVSELLPELPQILETRRRQLRTGRDHLVERLGEAFPDWRVPELHGGLCAWVSIGSPVSSQLALAARNHGLVIAAGPRFGIDGAFERFLRVPIGYSVEHVDQVVDALGLAWQSLLRHPVADAGYLAEVV